MTAHPRTERNAHDNWANHRRYSTRPGRFQFPGSVPAVHQRVILASWFDALVGAYENRFALEPDADVFTAKPLFVWDDDSSDGVGVLVVRPQSLDYVRSFSRPRRTDKEIANGKLKKLFADVLHEMLEEYSLELVWWVDHKTHCGYSRGLPCRDCKRYLAFMPRD